MDSDRPPHPATSPTSSNRRLWALLAFALLVRGSVLLVAPHAFEADPDGYRRLAQNIVEHGTFGYGSTPTAYRPPLYPLILAPLMTLGSSSTAAIGALHVLWGVATVAAVVLLARRWGLDRCSLLAGALVAVDPLLIWNSTLVMTETLATFLTVLALWALTVAAQRPTAGRAMLAAATTALAALCRPTYLPWMAVAAVALPWFADGWRSRCRMAVVYCATGAVTLAPWVVRNQVQYGHPIASTTHGGYTFLLGNNPWFYQYLRNGTWGTLWDSEELDRWWRLQVSRATPAEEIRADRLAYQTTWDTIRQQPTMFIYSCIVHIGRLWSPIPHRTEVDERPVKRWGRYAVGVAYSLELLLALVGLVVVLRRDPWWSPECKTGREESRDPGLENKSESARISADKAGTDRPSVPTRSQRLRCWFGTWGWGLSLLVLVTGVHTFYWSNIRMRSPLVPMIAMAAAVGVAWVAGLVRRSRAPGKLILY